MMALPLSGSSQGPDPAGKLVCLLLLNMLGGWEGGRVGGRSWFSKQALHTATSLTTFPAMYCLLSGPFTPRRPPATKIPAQDAQSWYQCCYIAAQEFSQDWAVNERTNERVLQDVPLENVSSGPGSKVGGRLIEISPSLKPLLLFWFDLKA